MAKHMERSECLAVYGQAYGKMETFLSDAKQRAIGLSLGEDENVIATFIPSHGNTKGHRIVIK